MDKVRPESQSEHTPVRFRQISDSTLKRFLVCLVEKIVGEDDR
jgi:hypothetical protein